MSAFSIMRLLCFLLLGVSWLPAAAHADAAVMRKSATVYGQTISYLEAGSGPTLLLLHGLGSSGEQEWGAVIPELSRNYHVVAPDQLGFGQSSKPLIGYGVQTWVDMIPPFLDALHIQHFGLVGSSLGGWIATTYVLQAKASHMPMPALLILSDAAGHKMQLSSDNKYFSSVLSLASVRAAMSVVFYDQSKVTDAAVLHRFQTKLAAGDSYTIDSAWKNADASASLYVEGKLDGIKIPTLITWGENDKTIPLAYGRDFAAHIPGSRLVVIPASGHVPPAEKPAEFATAVEAFLAEHPLPDIP